MMLEVTDGTFEAEILQSEIPALVDFWAPWCSPCKMVGPIIEQLSTEFAGQVKIAKMNVDQAPMTPTRYGIRGIPTVILFKGGQEVDKIVGAVPKNKFVDLIKKHL
ncbi:MAG: thioredoxin [Myxococcales bacterium]|nr:thioredoxin [Myxococcales bacterium]